MSRIISCLSRGLVRATGHQAVASASSSSSSSLACAVAMTRNKSAIFLSDANSNGHIISIQACRSLSTMFTTSRRNLYTENALGIAKLDRLRSKKDQMFIGSGAKERYIERLTSYVQNGDIQSIFKDDLINLIGIATTEKDLDLLEEIVAKADNSQVEFFNGWGTSVMRLYYKMNQLDRALKNVKDVERFRQFFNLRSCYKVLISMLYDAQRYDDVLDVFNFAQEHLKKDSLELTEEEGSSSERDLSVVAFAAMAKINTQQTLEQAQALYTKIRQSGVKNVGLRPTSFVAYLAASNNQPKLALNMISNVATRTYISLRELKIISLIELERYEDILLQLREYVASIKRESNLLLQGTYDKIKENKDKIQDPTMRQELEDILAEIKEGGHVATATIEELIFKPIDNERLPGRLDLRSGGGNNRFQNDRYQVGGGGGGGYNNNYNNNRLDPRGARNQYGSNQYGNNQYGSNQYGNNQYNRGDRPQRRYNQEQEADLDEEGENRSNLSRGNRPQGRFNYQNMNLD